MQHNTAEAGQHAIPFYEFIRDLQNEFIVVTNFNVKKKMHKCIYM